MVSQAKATAFQKELLQDMRPEMSRQSTPQQNQQCVLDQRKISGAFLGFEPMRSSSVSLKNSSDGRSRGAQPQALQVQQLHERKRACSSQP